MSLQAQFSLLGAFNGANGQTPMDGLALSPDGTTLYGITNYGGANGRGEVFSIPASGGTPTVLTSFDGTNGSNPQGGVVLSPDGMTLYGTASAGGANNDGVVFSLPVTGGTPMILTSFNGIDGSVPETGLVLSGGTLYGTTYSGGANNHGVVFSLPVTGGTPTVLTSFNVTNGALAHRLLVSGSTLYGTTAEGGASGYGEVFSLPMSGGDPAILTSFNANVNDPVGGLVLSGSTLYGTATGGGAGFGEVYSVPVGGGTPTVLTSFDYVHGGLPGGDLVLSQGGGILYGTTREGGVFRAGALFAMPIGGGATTDLVNFDINDGDEPVGNLVLAGTTIYGTTVGGGPSGDGAIFSVPEPGNACLLVSGALAFMTRRRRARALV
jgi:uncharacterized repeat protein (TIGR03803 family)